MQWRGRRQSDNIEDRRGGGRKAGGIGIGSVVIALILWKVFGIDPQTTLGVAQQMQSTQTTTQTAPKQQTPDQQEAKAFVATILADTEDVWTPIFNRLGRTYQPPKLVMFTGQVNSACGSASSASGPFYCPADQKVYLDTNFFVDMKKQMGIGGDQNNSSELLEKTRQGTLLKPMWLLMKLVIMYRRYLASHQKFAKRRLKPVKKMPINCLYVWNYKRIVLQVFGRTTTKNAPSFCKKAILKKPWMRLKKLVMIICSIKPMVIPFQIVLLMVPASKDSAGFIVALSLAISVNVILLGWLSYN